MPNHVVTDTLTLLRRNLRHTVRYPSMTIGAVVGPVIMLLLFVGVLGKTLGAGLAGTGLAGGGGHGSTGLTSAAHPAGYIAYIAPGIIITAVASGSMATAVAVCVDMTEGVVDRFRTMPVSRVAILAAHVINSMLTTIVATAGVAVVSVALGFRPHATTTSKPQATSVKAPGYVRGLRAPAAMPERIVRRASSSGRPAQAAASASAVITGSGGSSRAATSWPRLNAARLSVSLRVPGRASATRRVSSRSAASA
jgi:hypothetical protein